MAEQSGEARNQGAEFEPMMINGRETTASVKQQKIQHVGERA